MASRVLSIEIGQVVTKICEIDSKVKNPKIYKSFMIATPEGVISDGAIQLDDGYIADLKGALSANKVGTKKVIFTIASTRIASREVLIPYVKPNKIGEVIHSSAEDYFPVELSEYKITYSLMGEVTDDKGGKKHKVLVLAVPEKLLQGYYDLAAACGLEIHALDYMGNSMFQAVKEACKEGTQLVAKIDELSTLFTVVQDGRMVSVRNAAYGVDEAINALVDVVYAGGYGEGFGYEDAIDALKAYIYIQGNPEEEMEDPESVKTVTDSLEYLVNGISRVMDFYNSRSSERPIETVYITGLGASFAGMDEMLQYRLGVPVEVVRSISGLSTSKNFDESSLDDYIACIGAAIEPMNMLLPSKKEREKLAKKTGSKDGKQASSKDYTAVALLLCVGGLVVAGALAVSAIMPYNAAQKENEALLRRIEELKPIEEVRNTYSETQELWVDADSMYKMTENHNEDLVEFIQELEDKMPSDILVLSMAASADTVSMNIEVASKESAAKVLQELIGFETIQIVSTGGLTDSYDEESEMHVVSFSVNCTYAEKVDEAEAEGEAGAQTGIE